MIVTILPALLHRGFMLVPPYSLEQLLKLRLITHGREGYTEFSDLRDALVITSGALPVCGRGRI